MNVFHESPYTFLGRHTAEQIETMFALLELEHEDRERARVQLPPV